MSAASAPSPSVLVHTTSIVCWPGGDHTVCIALTNDGLTVRTPGLTPDQADALATRLHACAEACRSTAQQAREAAATNPPPPASAPKPAPSANRSRLI